MEAFLVAKSPGSMHIMPNKAMAFRGEWGRDGNNSMDRITALLYTT